MFIKKGMVISMNIFELIEKIEPISIEAASLCEKRWDSIAKPLKSLGKLETAMIQIAGIQETCNVSIDKKALIIMCADNGVVDEKVTQSGKEITALVSENFLDLNSCVCIMAQKAGVDVFPVDIGIERETRLVNRKIAYGTKNMKLGPAMTREEAIKAIEVGIQEVMSLKEKGYQLIATGEMGIGNTTTSSAIASVLLNKPVEEVTGKGAGLTAEGLKTKIEVIKEAILVNKPNKEDPIDVLSKIGGFDIAGLVGVFLGGAICKIPVIVDGFISSVAALLAINMNETVEQYVLASHVSKENAGEMLLKAINKTPLLSCDMCLGEGTGAVALIPLLEMGLLVYTKMSTFDQIEMEAYQPLS